MWTLGQFGLVDLDLHKNFASQNKKFPRKIEMILKRTIIKPISHSVQFLIIFDIFL